MPDVSIAVSNEIIKPIIEAKIKAALLEGLGSNRERVLEEIISKLLMTKVDHDGKVSNYSSGMPWLEWLVKDLVTRVTREAMTELVQNQKPELVKAIRQVLKKRTMSIAENFVDSLEGAAKDNWRTSVNITFSKPT